MPRRDGIGPMGKGPQTGWGDSYCAATPGSDNTPQTRGARFWKGFRMTLGKWPQHGPGTYGRKG